MLSSTAYIKYFNAKWIAILIFCSLLSFFSAHGADEPGFYEETYQQLHLRNGQDIIIEAQVLCFAAHVYQTHYFENSMDSVELLKQAFRLTNSLGFRKAYDFDVPLCSLIMRHITFEFIKINKELIHSALRCLQEIGEELEEKKISLDHRKPSREEAIAFLHKARDLAEFLGKASKSPRGVSEKLIERVEKLINEVEYAFYIKDARDMSEKTKIPSANDHG